MPIYEYQCRECGHRLDALQKMSDPRLEDCPECARPSLRKLVSAPHFRLKGSGWYETDFKNSGRDKADEGAQGGGSGADAGNGKPQDKTAAKDTGSANNTSASAGGGKNPAKSGAAETSADSG